MHQPPPKALPLFIFPSSLGLLGSRPPCIAPAGGATGALPPLLLSFRAKKKMSSKGPNRRSKASLSKASVVQLRLQKNLGKLGKKYAIRKGCLLTDCLRAGIQRYPALQHRHLHCIAYCQWKSCYHGGFETIDGTNQANILQKSKHWNQTLQKNPNFTKGKFSPMNATYESKDHVLSVRWSTSPNQPANQPTNHIITDIRILFSPLLLHPRCSETPKLWHPLRPPWL